MSEDQACGACGAQWTGFRNSCPTCGAPQPIKLVPVVLPTSGRGWPWIEDEGRTARPGRR